jgi:septal ring factor EnvC (AmiA/AmiB activator)
MTRTAALLLLALAWPLPSVASADAAAELAAASSLVAEAGQALAAAEAAPEDILALGQATGAYAAALATLRADVLAASAREAALAEDLDRRRLEISRLLSAMQAMSRAPEPTLHPQGPLGAARASAMMERLTPAMQQQARNLAAQIGEMRTERALYDEGQAALVAGLVKLNAAQVALEAAMAGSAPDAAASLDPDLTMMARDSASLTALAAALAEQPGAPPPPEGPAEGLAWPVAGTVLNHFDEPDAARVRRPGLVVGAPPLALVTAPADAVVRYAGPFLEYGYVVVLEPDSETMVVLAGLARLRVATGQRVLRGEFLGLMGGHAPDVEEYVMSPEADTGAGGGETLYIEVRHGRGPVDPEPLFAGDKG